MNFSDEIIYIYSTTSTTRFLKNKIVILKGEHVTFWIVLSHCIVNFPSIRQNN